MTDMKVLITGDGGFVGSHFRRHARKLALRTAGE